MEVKLNTVFAQVGCLALFLSLIHTLGAVSLATADEATVSDREVNSTIFISDEHAIESPIPPDSAPPQSAEGSIVFVEDEPLTSLTRSPALVSAATLRPLPATITPLPATSLPTASLPATSLPTTSLPTTSLPTASLPTASLPTTSLPNTSLPNTSPAAGGDLSVVSNQPSPSAVAALRPLPGRPATAQLAALGQSNVRAPATSLPQTTIKQVAAVELSAAPAERDQPGDIQFAVHAEEAGLQDQASRGAVSPNAAPSSEASALAKLLITAHQLSHQAKTADEYARIAHACAEAIRLGAASDQREFAKHLSSWALNRRGQLRADQDEPELAHADFQAALDFNPKNWRAMHNRGVNLAQAGQFADAFDDFNAVIQLNPRYAKAYANRATLYVQAKDLQSAIKDYERAIEHDREFATAHVGLGRACHMSGRWEEAVAHFTCAVQLDPTSADIVCSRGDLQADMGNYGEALADYARTIELNPEFAHAYRNGAWLLATCPDERFRDPENAILGARQALEYSYGDRHVALDTLAAALASNGQFDAAIQTVTQAVDLAPEEAKFTYLTRLQLYQDRVPFRTAPAGEVSQVDYEVGDQ